MQEIQQIAEDIQRRTSVERSPDRYAIRPTPSKSRERRSKSMRRSPDKIQKGNVRNIHHLKSGSIQEGLTERAGLGFAQVASPAELSANKTE